VNQGGKMKVLLVNGSPNMKGCTYTALTEVEKNLNEAGVDTAIIHVGNRDLRGCIACGQCKKIENVHLMI
jgi:multimeric flavodoxin WrbA